MESGILGKQPWRGRIGSLAHLTRAPHGRTGLKDILANRLWGRGVIGHSHSGFGRLMCVALRQFPQTQNFCINSVPVNSGRIRQTVESRADDECA